MKRVLLLFTLLLMTQIQAITLKEWNQLDAYEKYEVLYDELVPYEEYWESDLEEMTDTTLLKNIQIASQYILKNVSDEAISQDIGNVDYMVTIGGPTLTSVNVYKIEDTIIGYQLAHYQDGGATKEFVPTEETHYATPEEAAEAGIDINADVNWQVHSMVEIVDGMVLELNLDVWNEGGWSWSGW